MPFYRTIVWAPDGDEAFDDGSYVLQVESGDQVRLIAFVGTPDFLYDPSSLATFTCPAMNFTQFSKTGITALTMNGDRPVSELSGSQKPS